MPSRIVALPGYEYRGTLLRRVALGGQPRHLKRKRSRGERMSINKRNIDTGEVSKPSPGPIRPSGAGNHATHRRENELAAEDAQRRDDEAELCEDDLDEPMTADQAEQLRILCEEADEDFDPALSRDAAERQIRRLQHRAGYKP